MKSVFTGISFRIGGFCLLLFTLSMLPLMSWAGAISESEALQRAQAFLSARGRNVTLQRDVKLAVKGRRAKAQTLVNDYYVFNVGDNGGFVVMSGDDRTVAVLGYADSGSISSDAMPDGLRYLLEGYAEQIAWLEEHGDSYENEATAESAASRMMAPARSAIAPLIETRWNQGAPYNNNCPLIDGEKTVTGCVATSMAQLMYYHKWPQNACTAIPGYTTTTEDKNEEKIPLTVDPLTATTFSWNDMTTTYSSDATGAAADAVAKLMQYCGVSLQMVYGLRSNGGSSSYSECIPSALKSYFCFDGGVRHTYRQNYSYQEWVSLIYSELADSRPVALGGQSMGGGHSFVCDGFDAGDYFHINWGWGGSSDGYFRLSALNPDEQGVGGSSTLDGFSFTQVAVIGIQPPVSGNKDYCLSLEGFRFSTNPTEASRTFTRESSSDSFTGIGLYAKICSYKAGTNSYDYAVQLVDGNSIVVHTLASNNASMVFNTNLYPALTNLSIPSSVADGTYYIKMVSRPSDATDWQECCDGDRYQMTAVIDGNNLTITVPIAAAVYPTAATITVSGNLTKGYEQQVTASITGGAADYHGNIMLGVNGKAVMGKTLDIPAGKTVDAHFSFIPSTAGEYTLSLYSGRNSETKEVSGTHIGTNTTVTIGESDATDALDLSFSATIDNLTAGGALYGKALRATVTVSNASTTNSYAGQMNCSVRKWTKVVDGESTTWSWESIGVTSYPLVVDKEGSTVIQVARDDLEIGGLYSARITYQRTDKEEKVAEGIHLGLDEDEHGSLSVTDGYRLGDATGATTIHETASTIDAGSAAFVDLTSLSAPGSVTVTPSSNLNCVYLLAENAETPIGLSGKNVVKGSTAATITLQDGSDFYTPVAFTATNISYTRTFTRAANRTSGWNTLYLPFTVSSISCEDIGTVDWFHSASDTGKNFWLREFTADGAGTVTFDYADAMTAYTPYIIAVPDDRFGSAWRMTGRTVTFSGTNASILPTQTTSVSGNSYKFSGSTVGSSLSDVYLLNDAGSKFVKASSATAVDAFRAWFDVVSISSLSRTALSIVSPDPDSTTGIGTLGSGSETINGNNSWYTLDGRRLSEKPTAKGIYIHQGKKLIIR